jgi:hypothetical protein
MKRRFITAGLFLLSHGVLLVGAMVLTEGQLTMREWRQAGNSPLFRVGLLLEQSHPNQASSPLYERDLSELEQTLGVHLAAASAACRSFTLANCEASRLRDTSRKFSAQRMNRGELTGSSDR